MGQAVEKPRATRWPPPRHFQRQRALEKHPGFHCPECRREVTYTPPEKFRDIDMIACPCGWRTLVEFDDSMERRMDAAYEFARKRERRTR